MLDMDEIAHLRSLRAAALAADMQGLPVSPLVGWTIDPAWANPEWAASLAGARRQSAVAGEIVPCAMSHAQVESLALAFVQDGGVLHTSDATGTPVTIGPMPPGVVGDDGCAWGIILWTSGNATDMRFYAAVGLIGYCMRQLGKSAIVRALIHRGEIDGNGARIKP